VKVQVKDAMTRNVVSCHAESTLAVAGNQMLEGRFGVLPVVDQSGKAVGMITDRDIARAAVTRQRNAAHINVHEIMSRALLGCHPDDEVNAALEKMVDHCLRRLPVLDADGLLVGILSIEDLALRSVDEDQGISRDDFFDAFRRLCQRPSPPEPDITPADTTTPG
jgi:CBS domain-containing protein